MCHRIQFSRFLGRVVKVYSILLKELNSLLKMGKAWQKGCDGLLSDDDASTLFYALDVDYGI